MKVLMCLYLNSRLHYYYIDIDNQMKVQALVQHAEEMVLINESQTKKIKFLQFQKQKTESFIKDLEQNLRLNKQSIKDLAENKHDQAIIKLNEENKILHRKSQEYYQEILDKNALLLIEQQLRVEEKKFYNQRLLQFENTMNQLRKYLQDKEDSFTTIVNRLRKYQDLNEVFIRDKTYQFKNELQKQINHDILRNVAEERDKWKQLYEKTKPEIKKLAILKTCLANEESYQDFQKIFAKYEKQELVGKQEKQQKMMMMEEKTKNTTRGATNSQITPMVPNKQLIKLLKKQKISSEILQNALNQAIQKNAELISENQQLVSSNEDYQYQIDKLETRISVLEKHLGRYELSYKWKEEWKAKCDLDRVEYDFKMYNKNNQDEEYLQGLKEDVEEVAKFMQICIPKLKLTKSCSEPRLTINYEEEDIEIEQV